MGGFVIHMTDDIWIFASGLFAYHIGPHCPLLWHHLSIDHWHQSTFKGKDMFNEADYL